MAIDSASGALPDSSLPTISSSWANAASKLRVFTSSLSAICKILFVQAPNGAVHQHGHMVRNTAGQPLEVIATFEQRNNAVTAAAVGHIHQFSGKPAIVCRVPVQLRQRIASVGIKTRRKQDQVGGEIIQGRDDVREIGLAHGLTIGMG